MNRIDGAFLGLIGLMWALVGLAWLSDKRANRPPRLVIFKRGPNFGPGQPRLIIGIGVLMAVTGACIFILGSS